MLSIKGKCDMWKAVEYSKSKSILLKSSQNSQITVYLRRFFSTEPRGTWKKDKRLESSLMAN